MIILLSHQTRRFYQNVNPFQKSQCFENRKILSIQFFSARKRNVLKLYRSTGLRCYLNRKRMRGRLKKYELRENTWDRRFFQLNFINHSGMTFLLIYSPPSNSLSCPAAYPFLKGAVSSNLYQKRTQNLILFKIGVL